MTSLIYGRTSLATAFVVALVLSFVACRGSSDRQEQPQADVETPPPSATIAVEWTDADLEKSAERNAYGSKPEAILARNAEGAVVFSPQTPQDHIATPFTRLQSYDGDRTLELLLDVRTAGGEACVANLQDQAFNMLLTAPCQSAGEQRLTAKVPNSVTGVRLYFQSASRKPVRLPARIRLTEQR